MLGKLFKHEFRNVGRMGVLLLIVAACVTALGALYLLSPLFGSIIGQRKDASIPMSLLSVLLGLLGLLSYAVMLVGISYGFLIWLGVRFYRSMYSDQGYLTHTLPVKPIEILIAKTVTAGVWVLILSLAMYAMVIFLVLLGASRVMDVSIAELVRSASDTVGSILDLIKRETGFSFTGSAMVFLITILIAPFSTICIMFGAVTLGQYSWKNKGLMGIIAYIGVRMAMNIASGILGVGMTMFQFSQITESSNSLIMANGKNLISLLINLFFAVVLFCWSIHVVQNRLNLE